MKAVFAVLLLFVCDKVKSQCYDDSEIAIHWTRSSDDRCLANYTLFNENVIDDNVAKGVTCSRRNSTDTDGTWTYETDGTVVTCSTNSGQVRCERGSGSVTLYTLFGGQGCCPNGNYTCCIEGLCISIRVYQQDAFVTLFPNSASAIIESCSIIPPSNVTVIPQQYTVQMITSGVPPTRLFSSVDCTDCDGTTRGDSYYTLIDLTEERYQYSVPVTWNAATSNTNHQYSCGARFGQTGNNAEQSTVLPTTKAISVNASNTPTINDYEMINATAIKIQWSITGDVNGFVINITSSGLSTITQQLTNSSAREFVYDGLLPERNYTIEVRGYYELLGLADSITVRLEAGINSVNTSLVTVKNGLSTQEIQVNCYTFRVELNQITWSIDSVTITPGSSYQSVTGSELIDSADQIYRHYIRLTGSFSGGNVTSCSVTVNGVTRKDSHVLQVASFPPTGPSATILSPSSLSVNWTPLSGVTGYIIQYMPNEQLQLLNGEDTSSGILGGLIRGTTYQISVYSYLDLPSGPSSEISVLFDVPLIIAFDAQPLTPTSIMISWITQPNSITDSYTVTYTRLCDNVEGTMLIEDGASNSATINNLYPGLQYSVSITPVNILGKGMERTDNVTLEESGSPTGAPLLQPPIVINSTAVRLSWGEVNCTQRNGVITGYSIQYNIEGGPQTTVNVNGVTTSIVITGLTERSSYFISIAAINSNGIGPFSQQQDFFTEVTTTDTSSDSNAGAAAGAAVGSILFVAIIITVVVVVVLVIFMRQRSRKETGVHQKESIRFSKDKPDKPEQEYVEMDNQKKPLSDVLYSAVDSKVPTYEAVTNIYANTTSNSSDGLYADLTDQGPIPPPFDPMIPEIFSVPVNDFGQYVSEKHFSNNLGFRDQFKTLYTGEEKSCTIGQGDQYKLLNRFKNITVYDDNRIVLSDLPTNVAHNEFINGSYVDGYSVPGKYIATQGPLPRTVGDFWHMVWQEKVRSIVMLTNLIEEKKKKCACYWPEKVGSSETYGHFNVTNLEEEPLLHIVIRTLRVELMGTSDSVIVKHYQYITWPDYGVPESVSPFMTLNRRVMNSWNKDKGPMIVHCSAGVGRTGTFIAVDMALEQAEKERKVDVAGIVTRLREQRMKMVQTDAQYAFIHDAVLEAIVAGSTEITVDMFEAKLRKWRQPSRIGTTPIQTQFQLLGLVTPDPDDVIKQTAEKFPRKNRSMQFLPPEKWRVLLKGEVPDYIHATSIHGYREKKAFILAQSPMENTVRDFWKMIMCYKVSAIVMCCGEQENRREVCFPYWDQNVPVRFDDLIVEVNSVTQKVGFIQRELKVHNVTADDKANSMNVVQFQFTSWPDSGVCKAPQIILAVLDEIGKVQRKSGKGPVVVHCSDTVGRSGMFCAVNNAIEQCKAEGLVDVFQATKAVRMHKPGAVTSLDQYDCIHDIILRYLEQNSSYSNFQGNFQ